eukprot:m.195654 g.195654  ORF g.195654 m.195654 type:complete len:678 (-) comp15692_c0_seq6:2151-4184(-)
MGLFTDVERQKAVGSFIYRKQWLLFPLLFFGGLAAVLIILPMPEVSRRLHTHENAMAPASAGSRMKAEHSKRVMKMVDLAEKNRYLAEIARSRKIQPKNYTTSWAWIRDELEDGGFEVFEQQYTVTEPLTRKQHNRTNLYGIWWAWRSDRSECLLLHAPRTKSVNIALSLGLASFFSKLNLWSRNFVILFSEDRYSGLSAFLDEYNDIAPLKLSQMVVAQALPKRAGDIHSGISIDFDKTLFQHIVLGVGGINGRMPNLDLIQASMIVGFHFNIPAVLSPYENIHEYPKSLDERLRTLLAHGKAVSSCEPDGPHALLLAHGIEAVTVRASKEKGKLKVHEDAVIFIEGIYRVLNNLVQKFNQCFYFYLFVDGKKSQFIPLSVFLAPILIMILPLALRALCCWYGDNSWSESGQSDCDKDVKNKEESHEGSQPSILLSSVLVVLSYLCTAATLHGCLEFSPKVYELLHRLWSTECPDPLRTNMTAMFEKNNHTFSEVLKLQLCDSNLENLSAGLCITISFLLTIILHQSLKKMFIPSSIISWVAVEAITLVITATGLATIAALVTPVALPLAIFCVPLSQVFILCKMENNFIRRVSVLVMLVMFSPVSAISIMVSCMCIRFKLVKVLLQLACYPTASSRIFSDLLLGYFAFGSYTFHAVYLVYTPVSSLQLNSMSLMS